MTIKFASNLLCKVSIPLSQRELYWTVRSGFIGPSIRYMAGSRAVKSVTVALYKLPSGVRVAVLLCSGSYGQIAMPLTHSVTSLNSDACGAKAKNQVYQ